MSTKADAFVELPKMKDNSVDLVLTDPPYDLNKDQMIYLLNHFSRVSKSGSIVFGSPENQWPKPDQYLFWVKPISTKNTSKRYSRFVEMIFVYEMVKWVNGRHWSQYTNVFNDLVDERLHIHRKPPSMIERLILNHTEKDDTILDPFAGSGTIEMVSNRLERKCISFDNV